MNANTLRMHPAEAPVETARKCEPKRNIRFASNAAVKKAHLGAIKKFARMFRKLAE